ncbi:4-hydroxy-tetrahydrodipicolinate synthase [Methanobacterium petrolearium]|uniref:4-hydroxy-tetrahydrodipicolinate synthase n=1 Tax=Methanobacterium petrolearium TaxID=710190 RepID=UPI001AEA6475|nr:4-hydroxy-tetrahydrodipicolinate synthase [Methanobacterium petrolearium]MBP1945177.1 4-hydroxy-tetrahydrodipicolinate synthase [Methanobacterium petrolearium]BDZ71104.1 4-hydroxy-tetrahydrodipicolinate synthase [Methanobacterium petrolearium]
MKLEGTTVAMVTPFTREDTVDEEGMRENMNYLLERGVNGLLAAGTTGESATITHQEQKKMIDILVDEMKGKVACVAGAGSNSSSEALDLVKYAENAGADYALVITPYYNKPQPHGLYEHYKMLTESTEIPIIVYNVPSRTGTDIDVETIGKVAQLDNIVALKEANPDMDKVSQIIHKLDQLGVDDFLVLSGNDNLTLPMISQGCKGVISVVGNVDPTRMSEMVKKALEGDFKGAKDLHYELYDLMKVLFVESNPVPAKTALNMMGRPSGHVRMPLAPLKTENQEKLKKVLLDLQLI